MNQKALRNVSSFKFCYLCGKEFGDGDKLDKDHVPPENIFAKEDRNPPLKLLSHESCNNIRSDDDQIIGQLVSLVRGKAPPERQTLLDISKVTLGDMRGTGILQNVVLEPIVRRWIRGFHAALYKSYLSPESTFSTVLPFPVGKMVNGFASISPIPESAYAFTHSILVALQNDVFDSIVTCNGKMQYICIWTQSDHGRWICVYALNLYEWSDLGDIHNFDKRGCTGMYAMASGEHPSTASTCIQPKQQVEYGIIPDVFHYISDYKELG